MSHSSRQPKKQLLALIWRCKMANYTVCLFTPPAQKAGQDRPRRAMSTVLDWTRAPAIRSWGRPQAQSASNKIDHAIIVPPRKPKESPHTLSATRGWARLSGQDKILHELRQSESVILVKSMTGRNSGVFDTYDMRQFAPPRSSREVWMVLYLKMILSMMK